jgi:hypothetical protein
MNAVAWNNPTYLCSSIRMVRRTGNSAEIALLHAAEQLGKVDQLADRVCAQAKVDRRDSATKG